jgi:hypothetical protein
MMLNCQYLHPIDVDAPKPKIDTLLRSDSFKQWYQI